MGYGKRAAKHIDARLTGEKRFARLFSTFDIDNVVPLHPSERRRSHATERPAELRRRDFEDATVGLSNVEAMEECGRCLRCDVRADH